MIIYHQNNVAAFAGNHVFYTLGFHQYASFRVAIRPTSTGTFPFQLYYQQQGPSL